MEIARDVGTRVVAPSCGWFADQWSDVVTYGNDEEGGLDPVSLTAAVSAALTRPMPRPADRVWRAEQRDAVRHVHAEVYAQVAADRRWERCVTVWAGAGSNRRPLAFQASARTD